MTNMTTLELGVTFGGSSSTSLRHNGEVAMLALADDDSFVVVVDGGNPGTAVAWSLATGEAAWAFHAPRYGLTSVAIATDGSRIAVSGYDDRVFVLDGETGQERAAFATGAAPRAMAFSPDGAWLLVGDNRTPRLFSLEGAEPRALKGHLSAIHAVAFSADGRYAATAGADAKTKVHDVAKAKVLATSTGGYFDALAFVAGEAHARHSRIFELPRGEQARLLHVGSFDGGGISGNRRRIATRKQENGQARVTVVDVATGETAFERIFDSVHRVALTHAGDRLVIARSAALGSGTSLEVWSLEGEGERLLPRGGGHLGGVSGIASCSAAKRPIVVSASTDRMLKLWDVESGSEIETLAGAHEDIGALAVSADGGRAVTAGVASSRHARAPQRWDLRTMRIVGELDIGELGVTRDLAISPDGQLVAASFSRRAAIFDLATGALRVVLEKHAAQIDTIAFSHDGKHVLTGAADNLIKVWALDGKEEHAIEGHTGFVRALAPLPDGTCVSASGELIRFAFATGEVLSKVSTSSIDALAASPDGTWLIAIPERQRRLELWSLLGGTLAQVHTLGLDEEPTVATFLDPTTVLVGTRRGGLVRIAIVASSTTNR